MSIRAYWGDFFDYGDVTIRGTGTTLEPIREVDRPIALRNEVTANKLKMFSHAAATYCSNAALTGRDQIPKRDR